MFRQSFISRDLVQSITRNIKWHWLIAVKWIMMDSSLPIIASGTKLSVRPLKPVSRVVSPRTTSAHKTPVAAGASRMKENSSQFMINPIYFYNPSHPFTLFLSPAGYFNGAVSFYWIVRWRDGRVGAETGQAGGLTDGRLTDSDLRSEPDLATFIVTWLSPTCNKGQQEIPFRSV